MRVVSVLLVWAIVGVGPAGCDRGGAEPTAREPAPASPSATAPAATPSLPIIDLEGLRAVLRRAGANGRLVVIDFWATWCEPCVAMFPSLHAGLTPLRERVEAVTVTLDSPDRVADVIEFLNQHQALEGAYMLDPDSDAQVAVVDGLGQRWRDVVVPAVLVFTPDGDLAGEFLDGKVEPILQRVRELLTTTANESHAAIPAHPGANP